MSRILFLTQEAAGEQTSPGDSKLRGLRADPGLKGRVGLRGGVARSPAGFANRAQADTVARVTARVTPPPVLISGK